MNGYTVTLARPEDLPFLAGVEQRAATMFPPGSIPDAIRSDNVPRPLLEEALNAGNLWVALDATGTPVGFALLLVEGGLALLTEMDVDSAHGRRGLGRNLIAAAAARAAALGHDALYLTTFSHVPWNMPFYARQGFALLEETQMPPGIKSVLEGILRAERARGLENRVAMRLALSV